MLTDAALKALKPKENIYKVADRDGTHQPSQLKVTGSNPAPCSHSTTPTPQLASVAPPTIHNARLCRALIWAQMLFLGKPLRQMRSIVRGLGPPTVRC